MSRHAIHVLLAAVLVVGAGGCSTSRTTDPAGLPQVPKRLAKAEALYQQENYRAAIIECIDLSREDPDMDGLRDLQHRIVSALAEQRAEEAEIRAAVTHRRMDVDIQENRALPDTYGVQRRVKGETGSLRGVPSAMEKVLEKKVTVHLDGVSLDDFILAIGASEDINIIADSIDSTKTMTIRAEDVPLSELLDYISRNLGVAFFVGESMIWATQRDQGLPTTPMDTRMYRLRKGISSMEIEAGGEQINLTEAIDRFVPQVDGSDLLFNSKAHVLIAKNTRQNLSRIEDLIEALDVCPPQVIIEARFISTAYNDLRELGIDWVLNSPIVVSQKKILRNGVPVDATHTQIDASSPESIVGFTPFTGEAQGLNLSYQGLLTDPMFQAVLHALETSGKSRTLSVPKVTTVNNRPATIRIGEDFRYFEEYDIESTPSTTDTGQTTYQTTLVPVGTPVLEELGIELQVTPSVGADLLDITLKIIPEISEFVRYEFYETGGRGSSGNNNQNNNSSTNMNSAIKLPIFRRSRIETEVIVQSGETVVMGGLISSTESKGEEKVPFLSAIPLIGRLFRHDNIEEAKQNLLIFVTASILSKRGENLVPIVQAADSP